MEEGQELSDEERRDFGTLFTVAWAAFVALGIMVLIWRGIRLDATIKTLNRDIGLLNNEIDTIGRDVSDIESDVDDIETTVGNIEDGVDDIQSTADAMWMKMRGVHPLF